MRGFFSEVVTNLVADLCGIGLQALGGPSIERIREALFERRIMSRVVHRLCTGFEELESAEGEEGELLVVDERFFEDPQARAGFLACLVTGTVDQQHVRDVYISLYGTDRLDAFERNLQEAVAIFQRELNAALDPADRAAFAGIHSAIQEGITSVETQLMESTRAILASEVRTRDEVADIAESVQRVEGMLRSIAPLSSDVDLDSEHRAQLNQARDLLQQLQPRLALTHLNTLKGRIWDAASLADKARILMLMGHAYLQLSNEDEAGRMFITALDLAPDSAKALSNAALGYLLQGDLERSCNLAHAALEADPSLDQASAVLVYASSPSDTWISIVTAIPEMHKETLNVAMALGYIAVRREALAEAERWYHVAVDNNPDNHPDPYGLLADVLLKQLLENESVYPIPGIVNPVASRLYEIVELYDTAWERASRTDLRSLRLNWLVNRATAKALLSDVHGAIHDVEEVRQDRPDDPELVRRRAILAFRNHDLPTAAALLRTVLDNEMIPDAGFWLGLVLLEDSRLPEAHEHIQAYADHLDKADPAWKEALYVLVGIKLRCGDLAGAHDQVALLHNEFPVDPSVLALGAHVARCAGQLDDARNQLENALACITPTTSLIARYRVVDELYAQEQFEDAAHMLEGLVDTQVNAQPTRQLLMCYYRSGNLGPALEICRGLGSQHGALRFVTAIESAIYEEIGEFAQAKQVCEEYLAMFPDDVWVQLRRAVVSYRLSDLDVLDKILEAGIDTSELTLQARIQLAHLHLLRNRMQEALDIAYETRRLFFGDPNTHLAYANVYIRVAECLRESLDVDEVTADTAVQVSHSITASQDWIIIEGSLTSDIARGEFPPTHPLIQSLLGKRKGESIAFSYGIETEELTIQEVRSKFVHAWLESLEVFERLFPGEPGIWRGQVKIPASGLAGPDSFRSLFDMLDRISAHTWNAEQLYSQRKCTLGSLAVLLGRNPVQVYSTLVAKPDLPLHCSAGDQQGRHNAVDLLASGRPLVADITSLLTMYDLDIHEGILAEFGGLGVVQGTLELIDDLLRQDSWLTGDHWTLARVGDRHVSTLVTEEQIQRNQHALQDLLVWARAVCDILPCRAALSIRREERLSLGEVLGETFVDTVLVAMDEDRIMYSDDRMLRELAASEYGIAGVWTQALLIALHDRGAVDSDTYNSAVVRLACLGYHHTSINAAVLLRATKMASWHLVYPLPQVLRMLGGKWSDPESAVRVAVEYVYALWQENLFPEQYIALVDATLSALADGRGAQREATVYRFLAHAEGRFALIPLEIAKITDLVQLWLTSHVF
jgi:tetratricopeptide (TPR) repeat protein